MKLRCAVGVLPALMLSAAAALAAGPQLPYCNMAEYAPLPLLWNQSAEPRQVNSIFPHPILPWRAVAATDSGLFLTDDAGRTWGALPQATAAAAGLIQRVIFNPLEQDTFYLASKTKGVWATADAGKSFRQIGTTANGLAADAVEDIILYPSDVTHQTLLAAHGAAAGGLSRSRNGGKSWDVVHPDYFFRRILAREKTTLSGRETGAMQIYLFGAVRSEPDILNLYNCSAPGELPTERLRDILLADMAFAPIGGKASPLYVATAGSGLYRIDSDDEAAILGPKDASWVSVSAQWGQNPDVVDLCLYDPSRLGLVLSSDELVTKRSSSGPLISSFVKDGAAIRPNANGTVFYAVANGSLTIGRADETVPIVRVTPPVFEPAREDEKTFEDLTSALREFSKSASAGSAAKAARELRANYGDLDAPYLRTRMTLTAQLPLQPAPPVSVTADMTRYGGSESTPMSDDGQHGDGVAGDGVYGLSFSFRPMRFAHRQNDWRRTGPGRVAIGITATYADGRRQGAVGVAGIYPKIVSYDAWPQTLNPKAPKARYVTEGDVKAELVENPPEIHGGIPALRIQTGQGPWSVNIPIGFDQRDITSYQGLAFWIKATEGVPPGEIFVQLRDHPELAAPVTTDRIAVISQGVREGSISSDYRCVVAPFDQMLAEGSPIETSKVQKIILSGDAGAPVTLWLDGLRILASTEEEIPVKGTPKK